MKVITSLVIILLAFLSAVPGWADEQEKATKEIRKIASISIDPNMRSIVNRTMADTLKVSRLDLVKQRQELNINYGGLFLVNQLTASGAKMEDIGAQLKAGKNIFDIANDARANWKQINSEAKKLNNKVDANIEKYFVESKKQTAVDQASGYDAKADTVAADSNISKQDFAEAQERYQHLHDLASAQLPTGDANVKNQGQGNSNTMIPQPTSKH